MGQTHQYPGARRRRLLGNAQRRVMDVCAEATSTHELMAGLRAPLNDALGLAGLLLSATDPQTTTLGTGTVVEHLPEDMAGGWMHNEFFEDDFNKFTTLHRTGAAATTLHRATQGHPQLSPRHRALHRPHGLGPELRTTFSSDASCWGVANLVREAGDDDFDDEHLAWLEQLRPVVAAGIQRTTATSPPVDVDDGTPGVICLDPAGAILSMTRSAHGLLADLWLCPFGEDGESRLPGEAYMIATLARARTAGFASPPAVTRLRGRTGRWLTLRGDCTLTVDGEVTGIVLVVQTSRPKEILPLLTVAHGLTAREREVLVELTSGFTAREIASRLFISAHTVRGHIKSILAKTGTASRSELMSVLFQHAPGVSPAE